MTEEFYQDLRWEKFPSMHPGGEEMTRRLLGLAFPSVQWPSKARALDLCCGRGVTLELLEKMGFEAWGIDLHPQKEGKKILKGTAQHLPWEEDTFYLGVCECSLSVLWQQGILKEALAQMYRVLAPGGIFLASDLYGTEGEFLSLEAYEEHLREAGFSVKEKVDMTPALKEFAARWLWEFASPFPFCKIARGAGFENVGYVLLRAEKDGGRFCAEQSV